LTRTFAAIFPPIEIRNGLSELVERLRKLCSGVKWVEKENMHLTLRFFGGLTDEQIEAATQCMSELARLHHGFKARLGTVGAFPSPSRARVIWVGVEEGKEQLVEIATALEERFVKAGLGPADKSFSPHLTVGRVRIPRNNPELEEAIRALTFSRGEFMIDSLTLTKSELTPRGPVYSPLTVARLKIPE
jgi:RNA 2',3'-cyclic 3'-phosphodiesterase